MEDSEDKLDMPACLLVRHAHMESVLWRAERLRAEEEERQRLAELEAQRQALLAEYYEAEAGWLQAEHAELEPLTQQYAHQRARVSECTSAGWLRLAHCMHAHRDARCHARLERGPCPLLASTSHHNTAQTPCAHGTRTRIQSAALHARLAE